MVRKVLGLDIERVGHENIRTVRMSDKDKLQELCDYYGTPVGVEQVAGVAGVAVSGSGDQETETIEDPTLTTFET